MLSLFSKLPPGRRYDGPAGGLPAPQEDVVDRSEIDELFGLACRVDPEHPRLGSEFAESWQLLLEPVDRSTAQEALLDHYRHRRNPIHPSDVYRFWERRRPGQAPAPPEQAPSQPEQDPGAEPPQSPPRQQTPNTLSWLMNASEAPTVTFRSIELYPADNGGWEWTVSDHTGQQLARHRTDSQRNGMWAWGVEVGVGRRWKPVEEPDEFALPGDPDDAARQLHERYATRGYRPTVTTSAG